jgi:hypothetical protein
MRRVLAAVATLTVAWAMVGWAMAGSAGAPPITPDCSLTAANPTADAGATITATGTGKCVGVASVKIQVCLQAAQHTAGGTSWSNWTCNSKTPAPGTTVTVNASASCTVGHDYQVRTRTVGTGYSSSGGEVIQQTKFSSKSGVTRTCKS